MSEQKSETVENAEAKPRCAPAAGSASATYRKCPGCDADCLNFGTENEPCWGQVEAYYQYNHETEGDINFHYCQGHKGEESSPRKPYQCEMPND